MPVKPFKPITPIRVRTRDQGATPAVGRPVVSGRPSAMLALCTAPPAVPFAEAVEGMSAMGRSFWAEDRKVRSAATQAALGLEWRYPTYREGLAAIQRAEQAGEAFGQE